MNLLRVVLVVVALVVCAAAQWDKDDIEIFELQAALEDSEGSGTSFYSVLGVRASASVAEIRKAYRQKSLEWHPDKNPDRADAHKRFERLGLINRILRDERRDRYDFFLAHGFPRWSGSGYYYARFRPSLLMAVAFVVLASIAAQLFAKRMTYASNRRRLENLRRSALAAARGAWFQTPAELRGKVHAPPAAKTVRVPLEGFAGMPPAPAAGASTDWHAEGEKVRAAMHASDSGRAIDATVYADDSVAVRDPAADEWLPLELEAPPTLADTWPAQLVRAVLSRREAPADAHVEAPTEEPTEEPPAPAAGTRPARRARRRKAN